jgi:uncharacterized protein (TIGR03437 family)
MISKIFSVVRAAGLLAFLLTSPTWAATTAFTFNISGTGSSSSGAYNAAGSGTVSPFGNVNFANTGSLTQIAGNSATDSGSFSFIFASGDSFQATFSGIILNNVGQGIQASGTATISGGTGQFSNASGSTSFTFATVATGNHVFSCSMTGTGSITTASAASSVITVGPPALAFSFVQGSTATASQAVIVNNPLQQPVTFSADAGAATWLSVSPASGTIQPLASASVIVTANPSGLTANTYSAAVTLAVSGQQFVVTVNATVTSAQLALAISQTGLEFKAEAGAGASPSQSITVLNQGSGTLNWSATPSTLVGGWLSVSPTTGTAGESTSVSVNPTNLPAGDYYGLVRFTAAGASNSPQSAIVVLNVLPTNSSVLGAIVLPTGIIFVGDQGGANPASQVVTVTDYSSQSFGVTVTPLFQQGSGWLSTTPASATVTSAQPAQFPVSIDTSGLQAGVYFADLQFVFSDGSAQGVVVLLVVTPPGVVLGDSRSAPEAREVPQATQVARPLATAAACTPTKLLPVSTVLGPSFTEVAAWPTPLAIQVVDDCGSLMGPGNVVASFSTGDPPLSFLSLGGGMWSATWQPNYVTTAASVVITVQAQSLQPALTGTVQISGTLNPNQSAPAINTGGAVSAASFAANIPLAPGGFISIFGSNFAPQSNKATSLPLVATLGGTQAILAGETLPLLFTNGGQINAIVPYDITPNSTQQLIVQQDMAYSLPQTVTVASAQPGVFTQDQSGKGIGVIVVVPPDGPQFEVDSSHAATAGDALVIYCAGLGTVNPLVATGSAAPSSPLAYTSKTVTVTIGNQPAKVLYAGLAPNFAGLYQVDVLVPSGVAAAADVPVVLTVDGISSPPVTVPIQ